MSHFPAVRSVAITNGTTASATPAINEPGTVVAGDLLIYYFRVAVAGAIGWPDASYNEVVDASPDGADDQQAIAWRVALGNESGTITLSCTSGKFVAVAYAISNAANNRAPQLSTVATGTTPAQPDATTCTPTGTKDYLWLTLFSMEGEQTGITNYPTNYTLGQSGFASSGTAGVVATNVRMGGAARQLNAASEDAGAWTIAGTLDDWSAYTLAIHPPEDLNKWGPRYADRVPEAWLVTPGGIIVPKVP